MLSSARGQVEGVLILLWLALFLPGGTGYERETAERKETGRGEVGRGTSETLRTSKLLNLSASRDSPLPPAGAAPQPGLRGRDTKFFGPPGAFVEGEPSPAPRLGG